MNFIKREIFSQLAEHLKQKEITLIIGPRQTGKTTLMLLLKKQLEEKGKKTLFFNLDFDDQKDYFRSQSDLLNYLTLQLGKEKGCVFIDEVQRIKNAGLFLKGLYDRDLPYKFIVSGSGSLELKEKIHESLAGRKRIFEISPVTFIEFVNFRTEYRFVNKEREFFLYDKILPKRLFWEYFCFGGYPKVITAETIEEKKIVIKEIYQSYLEKDIQELLHLEKREVFVKLVTILSSQIGQLVNHTELCRTLGIDFETVKKYLWYLEKTFIIQKINPFYTSVRKELSKTPIYYFIDLGLRNFALDSWVSLPKKTDGFLFQNFVFLLLKNSKKLGQGKINFWRTKDKAEVDFVVSYGLEAVPVEVKEAELKETKIGRSFKNFLTRYGPKEALLVNKNLKKEILLGKTKIKVLPYFELLWQ